MTEIIKLYVPSGPVEIKTPIRVNFTRIEDANGKTLCGHSTESRLGIMEEICRRVNAYKELPSVEDLRKLAGHYHDGPYRSGAVVSALELAIKEILEADAAFKREVDGVWNNEN